MRDREVVCRPVPTLPEIKGREGVTHGLRMSGDVWPLICACWLYYAYIQYNFPSLPPLILTSVCLGMEFWYLPLSPNSQGPLNWDETSSFLGGLIVF